MVNLTKEGKRTHLAPLPLANRMLHRVQKSSPPTTTSTSGARVKFRSEDGDKVATDTT